jgi:hypothetical protein
VSRSSGRADIMLRVSSPVDRADSMLRVSRSSGRADIMLRVSSPVDRICWNARHTIHTTAWNTFYHNIAEQ